MKSYITDNEIACHSYEDAQQIASILLKNGYVVMVSREEKLYIVNFIWSQREADRNDVCFLTREEIDDIIFCGDRDEES